MANDLTINGVLLERPGFCRVNRSLLRLLSGPAKRGHNVVLPGAAGQRPYDRVVDATIYDLEMRVQGRVDNAGVAHPDVITGKIANLIWLEENVDIPGSALVAATLRLQGQADRTADVHVLNWQIARDDGPSAVVTFDLDVPAGRFV